nr:sigma-70 family RNA polymerase sigma factor [Nocardioidaceae bacterium]
MHDRDAYVRRLIVNAHISWWRRFARRESPVAEVRGTVSPTNDPGLSVPFADAVWRLCQSLPPKQRAAVVLKYYEDLTYSEIAELLRCPESTVRSHVHRALAALRDTIEEQGVRDV